MSNEQPLRFTAFAPVLLSLLAAAAGCAPGDGGDSEPTSIGVAQSHLDPGEPADPGQPGAACAVKSTTTLASGILYRPGNLAGGGFCFPVSQIGGYPLLVFAHGDGFLPDDYDHLGNHLASHGFLVVSTNGNSSGSLVGALDEAMSAGIGANGKIALGGHSVGGESAVQAAKTVRDAGTHTVSAVVALAPADQYGYHLTADASKGFLVLYGSRDNDVSGDLVVPRAAPPATLHGTSISLWDRSGLQNDAANPLTARRNYLRKHFIYVHQASHGAFSDSSSGFAQVGETPVANPADVRLLTRAYVHAYLRWFLLNDSAQEGFFEGPRYTPDGVEATGLQHRRAWMGKRGVIGFVGSRSRVIDDFERPGAWNVSTLGGAVSVNGLMTLSPGWAAPSYPVGTDPLYPCPHDTAVANVILSTGVGGLSHVTWAIPAASSDFSPFKHIGFRVALMYSSMFNDGSSLALDVRLTDTNGVSRTVSTSGYAEIAPPELAWYETTYNGTGDFTKSQMVMVKLPLSAFAKMGGVSLPLVNEVRISLPAGEAHFVMDDLELSF